MISMKRWGLFVVVILVLFTALASADSNRDARLHAYAASGDYEPAVLSIIESIGAGDLEQALRKANAHVADFPKSRVGHLLRADILKGMSGELSEPGASSDLPALTVKGLKHQISNRWKHINLHQQSVHTLFPASLVYMGRHRYVLVADLPEGRLYLYKNNAGQPELVRDYYMSVGSAGFGKEIEGDNKTPIGVYEINRYIKGSALPDLYGKGAFPVNYPNRYDRYLQRTGYGIWLHGTPSDTYARSPWASEGCFVISNDDLLDIGQYLSAKDRTPVILSDKIEWLDLAKLDARRKAFLVVLEQWKADWESLDTNALIAHYSSRDFNFGEGDYRQWAKRKRQVNDSKTFVQLDLDVESVFAYPGVQDMIVVKYRQRYLSNNYSAESLKEQYWQRAESGRWQIIYEQGQG